MFTLNRREMLPPLLLARRPIRHAHTLLTACAYEQDVRRQVCGRGGGVSVWEGLTGLDAYYLARRRLGAQRIVDAVAQTQRCAQLATPLLEGLG